METQRGAHRIEDEEHPSKIKDSVLVCLVYTLENFIVKKLQIAVKNNGILLSYFNGNWLLCCNNLLHIAVKFKASCQKQ